MKSTPAYPWLIAFPALIFSTTEIYPGKPEKISGQILHQETGQRIDKNGQFSITTWQQLPVTLVIEHPNFKKKRVTTTQPLQKQVIKLEPKPSN